LGEEIAGTACAAHRSAMSAYAAARTPETPENERQATYTQLIEPP